MRLLAGLRPAQIAQSGLDAADAHVAVADHLRRLLERVLRAIPEDERLARQVDISNALIAWIGSAIGVDPGNPDDKLVVPLAMLREVKPIGRGAAFARDTPRPLVPLSAADLLVNARGEPSMGVATPDLVDKFRAAFDSDWENPDYETYDPVRDAERFDLAVRPPSQTLRRFSTLTSNRGLTSGRCWKHSRREGHYSPTTMYRDYAVSPDLFHWESQSTTPVESPTGQRYLKHGAKGTHVFLFVRHRKHEAGRTAPYTFLGAADYVSHKGSRPIAITWRLRKPMPEDFFREARLAAG